jgi:hypothetical protein
MSLVTRATDASFDAASAGFAWNIPGQTAGEALDAMAPCYIKESDGLIYMSNATSANEAAELVGWTLKAYASGDTNVTLVGSGVKIRYGTSLTPGATLYMGATKGRLDTATTTGDLVGVAKVISSTTIITTRASDLFGMAAASGSVGASALTATLATGFIPLDIGSLRIIAANVIGNTSEGMLLDGNTAPSFQRVNGATDKALRVIWASSSSVEVQFPPVPKPPYLDGSILLEVHLMIGKDTNTDNTVTIDVQMFDGVGDTEAGNATAAIATATLTEYTASIAASDLAEAPGFLNISLVPGTHTTDAIWLYAAWIEFTVK